MAIVNMLVEGELDEVVARRLIEYVQHEPGVCYGKSGYGDIKKKIRNFNQAAPYAFYLCLVDFMDTKFTCPSEVISDWLPHRHPNMVFRAVVRELESWLLADHENLARFLHISPVLVPLEPEAVSDPKREMVNLARRSRSSSIRSALVPEAKSTAIVGKLYSSSMSNFILNHWNISQAQQRAPSLDRCIFRLKEL